MMCNYRECEQDAQFHYDTGAGYAIDVCRDHADLLDNSWREGGYSGINTEDNIYGWYLTGEVTKETIRRKVLP